MKKVEHMNINLQLKILPLTTMYRFMPLPCFYLEYFRKLFHKSRKSIEMDSNRIDFNEQQHFVINVYFYFNNIVKNACHVILIVSELQSEEKLVFVSKIKDT